MNIELRPLRDFEEDDFIRENQIAFDKAAVVEFGPRAPLFPQTFSTPLRFPQRLTDTDRLSQVICA